MQWKHKVAIVLLLMLSLWLAFENVELRYFLPEPLDKIPQQLHDTNNLVHRNTSSSTSMILQALRRNVVTATTMAPCQTSMTSKPSSHTATALTGTPEPTNTTKTPSNSKKTSQRVPPITDNSTSANNSQVDSMSDIQQLKSFVGKIIRIDQFITNQTLRYDQAHELLPKPDVTDHDMVAIYSKDSWLKLRELLLHTRNATTMVVNGGSTLAGGGNVHVNDRCHTIFSNLFYNLTVIDRAHGSRNSFHSAQLMHSYFPAHADILLWEFSINDASYTGNVEMSNQLLLYFEQLVRVSKERQQRPPLVILLYLWDSPFQMLRDGRIEQNAFYAHGHVATHFEFVVGHVNAAKYLEFLKLGDAQTRALVLEDHHHPNQRGHLILAFLLHDLVSNEERSRKPKRLELPHHYTWTCGNETREKRLVRNLVEKRYPIASYTGEEPKNDELLSGMLHATSFANASLKVFGVVNPSRIDRQKSVTLPCCGVANITFHVAQYSPIQGLQLYMYPFMQRFRSGGTIFLDHDNVTRYLINGRTWPCMTSYYFQYLFDWLALDQMRNVSQISLCNNSPNCAVQKSRRYVGLTYMVLYGGERTVVRH